MRFRSLLPVLTVLFSATASSGAEPVFDGMAAAAGSLFVSTADGKVRCFGK